MQYQKVRVQTQAVPPSGVISISAIRACGAAAFDYGRKKLKFSKNFFFQFFFFKFLSTASNLQMAANWRVLTQNVVKRFLDEKVIFWRKMLVSNFQKSDLSGGRRCRLARNSRKIAVTPLVPPKFFTNI